MMQDAEAQAEAKRQNEDVGGSNSPNKRSSFTASSILSIPRAGQLRNFMDNGGGVLSAGTEQPPTNSFTSKPIAGTIL